MNLVKVVMIGDVVGSVGLESLETKLPCLIKENNVDFVTVNGENSADGFGMTEGDFKRITAAGADVVTSGNHIWEKREFWPILENNKNILRPANYPVGVNGAGKVKINKKGLSFLVINLQGREFMTSIDCPFKCFDNIVNALPETEPRPIILVDFHAESSREKESLAYYADGRASLISGTHTHIQTADERILPKGSAYITDLGMVGNTDSVIGMDPQICMDRFMKQIQFQMKPAATDKGGEMHGVLAEIDSDSGKAVSIKRF